MSGTGQWRLPPLRPGHPADAGLAERRLRAAGTRDDGPQPVEAEIGGVHCLIVEPQGAAADGTILYLHGGGYRMGSPVAWIPYARRLATASGRRVILPSYRLAPEHPFPAALHDAAAVYHVLAAEDSVVVAGDSAGAGLAAALCLSAAKAGQPAAGLVLVSPMLDLAARDDSYDSHAASDAIFSREAVLECAELYLQGHPADDPLVSPLLADPALFPPALILAGGTEVLLGESLALARRLALADRRVSLHVAPGMGHVWPMLAPQTDAAARAVATIAAFADEALATARTRSM